MAKEKQVKSAAKAVIAGCVSAILVFILGFGVMYSLWNDPKYHNTDLPGLFYYRAAAIGDSICLPFLVGTLITYVFLHEKADKRQKRTGLLWGILAGMAALAIQISWLVSDTTKLNWTIPRQHFFNLPGWYHAGFFVGMFAVLGFLFTRLIQVKRKHPLCDESHLKLCLQALVWFFGSLFLFLLALDDYTDQSNYFTVLGITLTGIAAVFVVFAAVINRSRGGRFNKASFKCELSAVLSGSLSAFSLVNIINIKNDSYWYIIVCVTLMVVFLVPDERRKPRMLTYYFLIVVPTVLMELAIFSQSNMLNGVAMGALTLLVPGCIAMSQKDTSEIHSLRKGCFFGSAMLLGLSLLVWKSTVSIGISAMINETLVELLIGLIIVFSIPRYVQSTFRSIIDLENQKDGPPAEIRKTVTAKQALMYLLYLSIYAGGTILVIRTAFPPIDWGSNRPYRTDVAFFLSAAILLVLLIGFTVWAFHRKGKKSAGSIAALFLLGAAYTVLILSVFLLGNLWEMEIEDLHWSYLLAILSMIGFAVIISKGFLGNISEIRGILPNRTEKGAAIILFLGVLFTDLAAALQVILYHSIISILIYVVCLMLAGVALPGIIAKALARSPEEPQLTKNSQISGVLQDGVLYSITVIFCKLFTIFSLPMLFAGQLGILESIVAAVLLIEQINWPLLYCMKNNNHHYTYRKAEVDEESNLETKEIYSKQLRALRDHLSRQNKCTLLVTFPFCIFTILRVWVEHISDDQISFRSIVFLK